MSGRPRGRATGRLPVSPPSTPRVPTTSGATELGGPTVRMSAPTRRWETSLRRSARSNATAQQFGTRHEQSGTAVYGRSPGPTARRASPTSVCWCPGVAGATCTGTERLRHLDGLSSGRHPIPGGSRGRSDQALRDGAREPPDEPRVAAREGRVPHPLGNVEHAGRMEHLRLMASRARPTRKHRRGDRPRMRDWERRQASSDATGAIHPDDPRSRDVEGRQREPRGAECRLWLRVEPAGRLFHPDQQLAFRSGSGAAAELDADGESSAVEERRQGPPKA